MNKILTISIAAYNVEEYIENTIQSCLSESTENDVELLIIDDGGQDKTVEIAERWRQKYPNSIRVIKKGNGGYGSTINTGLKLARGKYFKQLDGDDWFDIKGLEALINDIKTYDVDMIFTPNVKYYEVDGTSDLRDNAPDMESGVYNIESVHIPGIINMHSITYKTQLLRDIGLRITEHCFYTDAELVLFPLPFINTIYISHIPLYYYRIGMTEQSMSYEGLRKHFGDHVKVLNHIYTLYNGLEDKTRRSSEWIYIRLKEEVINQYRYFCVLPLTRANFIALKEYDQELKMEKKLYADTGNCSRFVRVMRKSAFLMYPVCYLRMKRKMCD